MVALVTRAINKEALITVRNQGFNPLSSLIEKRITGVPLIFHEGKPLSIYIEELYREYRDMARYLGFREVFPRKSVQFVRYFLAWDCVTP